MEVGCPVLRVERVPVRDVHLGPQVRPHEEVGHARGQVVLALPPGVVRKGQALHEILEPVGKVGREVIVRRPVLELEQHGAALVILHPGREVLESVPEQLERNVGDGAAGHCVHDGVFDVAKLLGEGFRAPQVLNVQLVGDVGHNDGLAANPLLLKKNIQMCYD